jgi:hypothetical protein
VRDFYRLEALSLAAELVFTPPSRSPEKPNEDDYASTQKKRTFWLAA